MKILMLICLLPACLNAQVIPPKANTIVVKNVGFIQVCTTLLDSGYTIAQKDNDLQTAITEPKVYPKSWNAAYKISVRVKDSIAYFTATFTAPYEQPFTAAALKKDPLWNNDKSYHHCNKRGKTYPKSLAGMPFMWMNSIALSFKRDISYLVP